MNITVRELMLAGAHFGHRTRFWNPKMAQYIYGTYHNTHIINLDRTLEAMKRAREFVKTVSAENGVVLYVGAKQTASDAVAHYAKMANMPYINQRWLGGMLTNFKTTGNSVSRLAGIEEDIRTGVLKDLTKKEGVKLMLNREKLEKSIGGIRDMKELPDAIFLVDAGWHKGAVKEAGKLGIPIVAVVDTNHSPDGIEYVIPGNDDSKQAIEIYLKVMSEAVLEGVEARDRETQSRLAAAQ